MPAPLIEKIHEQTGKSKATIEKDWQEAKQEVKKEHPSNKWAYVTKIVEERTGYHPNKNKKG